MYFTIVRPSIQPAINPSSPKDFVLILSARSQPCSSLYLENDVSCQQPAVSGNHSITINVLDNDMDKWGLTASHEPDGEALVGIHSIDLDAGNFPTWNQVIELWKDSKGQRHLFKTPTQWAFPVTLAKLSPSYSLYVSYFPASVPGHVSVLECFLSWA